VVKLWAHFVKDTKSNLSIVSRSSRFDELHGLTAATASAKSDGNGEIHSIAPGAVLFNARDSAHRVGSDRGKDLRVAPAHDFAARAAEPNDSASLRSSKPAAVDGNY